MQPSDNWRRALLETLARLQRSRRVARGYSPKQILDQLRLIVKADSTGRPSQRNLSLQLRAALRRAVGEGLLKLRAGRYVLAAATDKRESNKKQTTPKEDCQQPKQQLRQAAQEDALPAANKSKTKKASNKRPAAAPRKRQAKAKKSTRAKR